MKNLTCVFFSLFSVFLLPGCKKEEPINNPVHEKLLGTWEWVASYGGIGGGSVSSSSSGYTFRMTFTKDGKCKFYRNNKPTGVARYAIVKEESIFYPDKTFQVKTEIDFGVFQNNQISYTQETINFRGEDLGLSQEAYDGFGSTYVRVK